MQTTTTFDTSEHHIYLAAKILDCNGVEHSFRGVLDTGAPATEFSDEFLLAVGILEPESIKKVDIQPEQQTARYGRIVLPRIQCLGQTLEKGRGQVLTFHFCPSIFVAENSGVQILRYAQDDKQ